MVILFTKDKNQQPLTTIKFRFKKNVKGRMARTISKKKKSVSHQGFLDEQTSKQTSWHLEELTEPFQFDNEHSQFVNAFLAEGNRLIIFCTRVVLTCNLDDFAFWDRLKLDILKNCEY